MFNPFHFLTEAVRQACHKGFHLFVTDLAEVAHGKADAPDYAALTRQALQTPHALPRAVSTGDDAPVVPMPSVAQVTTPDAPSPEPSGRKRDRRKQA